MLDTTVTLAAAIVARARRRPLLGRRAAARPAALRRASRAAAASTLAFSIAPVLGGQPAATGPRPGPGIGGAPLRWRADRGGAVLARGRVERAAAARSARCCSASRSCSRSRGASRRKAGAALPSLSTDRADDQPLAADRARSAAQRAARARRDGRLRPALPRARRRPRPLARARRDADALRRAALRLHAAALRARYVSQGDFLRLLSYSVLLVGVWRAIRLAEFGRAVAEERARVAREIHDGLAQYLFAVSTHASDARERRRSRARRCRS